MAYQVREQALAQWGKENLTVQESRGPDTVFRFRYTGSICVDGGGDFLAYLDFRLEHRHGRNRIAEAVITLDPENSGRPTSCRYARDQAQILVARHVVSSGVVGADLEEFLQADHSLNPGGCFCSVEHVTHKLLTALLTIRYYLEHRRPGQ